MCSGEDHGESERRMIPAASSSRNSASALRSLSGSRRRVCLSRHRRWLGTMLAGTVLTALWSRGRRRTLSATYRWRQAPWRAVSEFLSPAPGGRLGRPAARGRTRNLKLGWVCKRRRERKSQKMCAARTKGGGGWYPTLGLICRRRQRAVGRLAAHWIDGEGHCASVHHELLLAVVIL